MSSNTPTVFNVAAKAAIISPKGKVLILREAATDKNNTKVGIWGLVGGRLEPGETFTDCLQREVAEETGLRIQIGDPIYVGEWHPVIRNVQHQIIGIFILCRSDTERIRLSVEH